MRILIAEDELVSRSILTGILIKSGHDVIAIENGKEAMDVMLGENAPPMAILDWMMPGMNGVDVCRRIRAVPTDSPPYIIFLTAMEETEDTVIGLEAGANDYIVKPYETRELQARVDVGRRVIELQESLRSRVQELEEAASHIRHLQGILPICSYCHKIRNDQQSWEIIEQYISHHADVQFSHGICPDCRKQHFPSDRESCDNSSGSQ